MVPFSIQDDLCKAYDAGIAKCVLAKESSKDTIVSSVKRYSREGWPPKGRLGGDSILEIFHKLAVSLSLTTNHGCLLYGSRVVILSSLRPQVLQLLHLGHFDMQRMKQLARTAVYWPQIDADIVDLCHKCATCAEHQSYPPKLPNHPWMLPEKPWSRVHIDHHCATAFSMQSCAEFAYHMQMSIIEVFICRCQHMDTSIILICIWLICRLCTTLHTKCCGAVHAVSFLGFNWLVLIDAYSKYPCIHPMTSTSSKSSTEPAGAWLCSLWVLTQHCLRQCIFVFI